MKTRHHWILFSLLACVCFSTQAQEDEPQERFFDRKAEGWFWYKDPKEVTQPPQVPTSPPPPPDSTKAKPKEEKVEAFSVTWLRKNMPKLLDKAIDDPTKENVEAYLYAQRVALDKSQLYAEQARRVVASDPLLDENNRVPLATFAKSFFLRHANNDSREALRYVAQKAGLWLFFDSSCQYCRPQAATIRELASKYGFIAKYISVDGGGLPNIPNFVRDNGHVKLLNLKITPTTVLVVPPNNYYIVSQGMMAEDQLGERILLAADTNNLLTPDLAKKIRTYDRGVLSNDDMKAGASDDPKAWTKYLKERLMGKY
ncbi:conjugal transfer protein TraF [Herbaspirillum huttiense]|uniref:conjugal transfer protein TraF n=1 Tax=Herbaspirillum huttiense TaxID=863372 RepID=UPI0039AFEA8B